jgi:hypothetical protein
LAFERMNELRETQEDLLTGLVDLGLLGSVRQGQDLACQAGNCCYVTAHGFSTVAV